jgi:hypothetical protein
MSLTVDVLYGPQPAVDPEQGSGVGTALHPDQPVQYPWPPHDCLQLAALPTAVACARLHARNLLWEWGLDWLAPDAELLVAELMANAVRVTAAQDDAAVRLRLSSDGARVFIEVWDANRGRRYPRIVTGTPGLAINRKEGEDCSWCRR